MRLLPRPPTPPPTKTVAGLGGPVAIRVGNRKRAWEKRTKGMAPQMKEETRKTGTVSDVKKSFFQIVFFFGQKNKCFFLNCFYRFFFFVSNKLLLFYYASPTSGEAYRDRRLTTNFELKFFVCRVTADMFPYEDFKTLSVWLSAPRENKSS